MVAEDMRVSFFEECKPLRKNRFGVNFYGSGIIEIVSKCMGVRGLVGLVRELVTSFWLRKGGWNLASFCGNGSDWNEVFGR